MITSDEARKIALTKIEKDREQAITLADNLIEMTAKCGKFQAKINEDETITREILRQIKEKYESLGYTCVIDNSGTYEDFDVLTITW